MKSTIDECDLSLCPCRYAGGPRWHGSSCPDQGLIHRQTLLWGIVEARVHQFVRNRGKHTIANDIIMKLFVPVEHLIDVENLIEIVLFVCFDSLWFVWFLALWIDPLRKCLITKMSWILVKKRWIFKENRLLNEDSEFISFFVQRAIYRAYTLIIVI